MKGKFSKILPYENFPLYSMKELWNFQYIICWEAV